MTPTPPPLTAELSAPREERVAYAWLARLLGRGLGLYLRLVAATVRPSGPPIFQGHAVFAVWHESNLAATVAALRLREDGRIVSFSTRGFRGIVMNTMLRSVGMGALTLPDEGKATRAEAGRLSLELARVAQAGWNVVVSCDGPLGPYRVAKPGVLLVARESSVPILPWAISVRPAWRLTRRWDRHLVPLPFARLRVEEGARIAVEPRQRVKPLLAVLQEELDGIAARAERRMGGRPASDGARRE